MFSGYNVFGKKIHDSNRDVKNVNHALLVVSYFILYEFFSISKREDETKLSVWEAITPLPKILNL